MGRLVAIPPGDRPERQRQAGQQQYELGSGLQNVVSNVLTASFAASVAQYTDIFGNRNNASGPNSMPDKFDPYREALVVETATIWPEEYELDPYEQAELSARLHEAPEEAASLEYVRTHTGFCRTIYVTEDDYQRVSS